MTTAGFLAELRSRHIKVSVEGDRLRCTGPKGALSAELQSELSRRKAEILSCLREGAGPQPRLQAPPIRPVPRDRPLPLSFGQQRLWFLHQMDPASAAYNLQLTIPLPGVDVPLLERVLTEVVRRHETLRTTFTVVDGEPVQVIGPPAAVMLPAFDLSALPPADRAAQSQRIKWDTFASPFDLTSGPLIRFALLHLPHGAAELLIAQHHIVTDGWSIALLYEELRAISQAFMRGEPSPLPDLPVQYADYACWQRDWLAGSVLEQQLGYWRRRLDGLPVLELPTDRPRPAMQTFKGALQSFALSADLSHALRRLTREKGVTLYMTLLSVFQALLARYSGQTDIVVGTSNGNRSQVETERMIGFFVNTQVIRTDVSGDPTFAELVGRVSGAALEAYEHQDLPFEKLVEELQPRRDLSRSPLFDVMFILQNTPLETFAREAAARGAAPAAAVRAQELPIQKGTAKFDLTLSLAEVGDRICGTLEYSTDLFDDATITRMLGHFEDLVTAVAADPDTRLSRIPLLTEADRMNLARWNATSEPFADVCVHDLVTAQALKTPSAVAVEGNEGSLTYTGLERLSNQIARHLISVGVTPGSRVAVCVERTPRMVAALLGVLKAGAAYVPLDPEYPRERLAYMLTDCDGAATITERAVGALLPDAGGPRVYLDDRDGPIAGHSPDTLNRSVHPGGVAYVIYTSGSTGRPKGVMVPHRAVVSFLTTMARRPGLSADDVLVSVTTLAFDIAALELFLPLTVGARVVMADRVDTLDGARLRDRLVRSNATVLQATPATWRLLLEAGWEGTPQIRMLCGGEAISRSLADALLERAPVLWNLYGPTETTIWSAAEPLEADDRPIAIGRPVGNTTMYVLDALGQPVPPGIAGELHIGGSGVAYGYLNRADLTADRFLPDPFSALPGARMYRTGDLAKARQDGRLEYLGRADFQVKLRGFRIELPEIEAVLSEVESIAEAVAVIRTDTPGEPRLVAYVRPANGVVPDLADVRAHLRERLPAYMVPSNIAIVDTWPRTPNGKVDRKALPAVGDSGLQAAFVAPQTDAERKVAEIWRAVLRVDRVGANDNFFDLGGHSLLIVSLQGRLSDAFGQPVRVVDLFRFPTVQALARHLTPNGHGAGTLDGIQDRALRNREAARRRRTMREMGRAFDAAADRGAHAGGTPAANR